MVNTHFRSVVVAAALICAGVGAEPALAGVTHATKTVYHPVRGRDAVAMLAYLFRNPVDGEEARLASLLSQMRITALDVAAGTKPGQPANAAGCHISAFGMKARFTITLPKAVDERRLDRKTRKAWRAFVVTARKHEQTHLAINLELYRTIDREIRKLSTTGSCRRLGARFDPIIDRAIKRAFAKHTALDRRDTRRAPTLPIFRLAGLSSSDIKAFHADSVQMGHSVSALLLRREFRNR
ncbi:DUF922 domain-containing protein [Breoghania sp. L-A4]|uniref:DUF922 domain-containing protein n=1 Tax=Breoghania sp. L-A4 TaxID=2304600 RepID=UPI000E35D04B|nr:DUF922 domain-containing protein [Breoghania sp. L-A4]AXS40960.1 DUF922 domain-containing protein [Breoghania sp. L-A4]